MISTQVLRVDGMDFSDAETVFTTSKEGELNYRRFKRCIAEDVVRKSLAQNDVEFRPVKGQVAGRYP